MCKWSALFVCLIAAIRRVLGPVSPACISLSISPRTILSALVEWARLGLSRTRQVLDVLSLSRVELFHEYTLNSNIIANL